MKLIRLPRSSSGAKQDSILPVTHICSPWHCLWSRHKNQDINKDMSQDVAPLQVKASDELAQSMK